MATDVRLVTGLTASADVLITGLDNPGFETVRRKACRSGAPVMFILPGPFPIQSTGYPTSMVTVLAAPDQLGEGSPAEIAAEALLTETEPDGQNQETPVLDRFRAIGSRGGFGAADHYGAVADARVRQVLLDGPSTRGDADVWALWLARIGGQGSVDTGLETVLDALTVWFDPFDGRPVAADEALAIADLVEKLWHDNDRAAHCAGAQYWNHPSINATFRGRGGLVTFHDKASDAIAAAAMDGGRVVSWAGRTTPDIEARCQRENVPLVRIEDGFLRSVGLGAGTARGAMLAVDDLGIYYDPSRPSRLERLLQSYEMTPSERRRGEKLVEAIVAARVSKYNFGKTRQFRFPTDRRVVLVPGQVADDAAIRKSRSATIACADTPNVNLDLLRLARARNPDAFIVFKPHPDVETGLRKGKLTLDEMMACADDIATGANIIDLIEACDAVETFSSLSGFEALLRGKAVTVHGVPFYAGWGLTQDLTPIPERTQKRALADLVYLSLVVYARTIDPVSLVPCTPEFLIGRLAEQRTSRRHLFATAFRRHLSWLGRKLGV